MVFLIILKLLLNSLFICLAFWSQLFSFLPCQLVESNHKVFALEQATIKDVAQLLSIYKAIPENDSSKIVIYPEKIRRKKMVETIRAKQLFIARSMDSNEIVSFLKIYLCDNPKTLKKILCSEIRALHVEHELISSGYYSVRTNNSLDYTHSLEFNPGYMIDSQQSHGILSPRYLRPRKKYSFDPENQTYIYYGNAYTIPSERGHGLNTQLQKFALRFIELSVINHIKHHDSIALLYLYGQVNTNMAIKNSIRIFTDYTTEIRHQLKKNIPPETLIHSFCYRAYKPVFLLDEKENLIRLPDNSKEVLAGKGIGNILCHYFEEPPLSPSQEETSYNQPEVEAFNFNFEIPTRSD